MRLPLRLDLKPSRRLLTAVGVVHFAALAVLLPLGLSTPVLVLAITLLAASFLVARRRLLATLRGQLLLRSDGKLELPDSSAFAPGPATVVLPWLVVLDLPEAKGHRFIPLAADSLPAALFRELRVWLRWHAAEQLAR